METRHPTEQLHSGAWLSRQPTHEYTDTTVLLQVAAESWGGVLGPIQSRQQPGAEAWASSITAADGGLRGGAGPPTEVFV